VTSDPHVLIPFDRLEAISLKEAATIAGKSLSTAQNWCNRFHVGRRVARGKWLVSRVALQMLLDNNQRALTQYLSGDRSSAVVVAYFERLGLADVVIKMNGGQCSQNSQKSAIPANSTVPA
jgi:hypothetical protein